MFNLGILTVSDKGSRGQRDDESGRVIKNSLFAADNNVLSYAVVPDETDLIAAKLTEWADGGQVDVILTTGGTGLGPRDVTPEATLAVVDRLAPGFTEMMRAQTFKKTPFAVLSRAVAGVRGSCLIINLPGSARAVRECLEIITPVLPHALEILRGDVTEHTTNADEG